MYLLVVLDIRSKKQRVRHRHIYPWPHQPKACSPQGWATTICYKQSSASYSRTVCILSYIPAKRQLGAVRIVAAITKRAVIGKRAWGLLT